MNCINCGSTRVSFGRRDSWGSEGEHYADEGWGCQDCGAFEDSASSGPVAVKKPVQRVKIVEEQRTADCPF